MIRLLLGWKFIQRSDQAGPLLGKLCYSKGCSCIKLPCLLFNRPWNCLEWTSRHSKVLLARQHNIKKYPDTWFFLPSGWWELRGRGWRRRGSWSRSTPTWSPVDRSPQSARVDSESHIWEMLKKTLEKMIKCAVVGWQSWSNNCYRNIIFFKTCF